MHTYLYTSSHMLLESLSIQRAHNMTPTGVLGLWQPEKTFAEGKMGDIFENESGLED